MERNVVAIVLGGAAVPSSTVWGQENLEWPPGTTDEQRAEACNQRLLIPLRSGKERRDNEKPSSRSAFYSRGPGGGDEGTMVPEEDRR